MSKIKILPETIANQIAAGEVIQRPASVIKELVENSVDALATKIEIIIKDGGKTLIQVVDNGIGMSSDDARLAFERHATSKISTIEDLFNIKTKGFRGEALASIASIAQVEMYTCERDSEIGTHLIIEGNKLLKIEDCKTPPGTNILVKNLFFNVPARRKFLKSDSTEFSHIVEEFIRIAIPHHDIEFKLIHNNQTIYQLPAQKLKERIIAIFDIRKQLIDINLENDIIKIYGYITAPEYATKTIAKQYFFVNNRFFKSMYFLKAVQKAYENLISENQKPNFFIFFEVEPQKIDVNIHPTKTEINFEDSNAIFNFLVNVIRKSLTTFDFVPAIDFDNAPIVNFINSNSKSSIKNLEETFLHHIIDKNTQNLSQSKINFEEPKTVSTQSSKDIIILKNKYLLTNVKSGLLIINIKEALKQIKYEELLKKHTIHSSISCLYPIPITLTPEEENELHNILNEINKIGFQLEKISHLTYNITSIPSTIQADTAVDIIKTIIHLSLIQIDPDSKITETDVYKQIAIANSAKISINNYNEAQELINKLFNCSEHQYNFEGKQIMKILSLEEIDKLF